MTSVADSITTVEWVLSSCLIELHYSISYKTPIALVLLDLSMWVLVAIVPELDLIVPMGHQPVCHMIHLDVHMFG